MARRGNRRQAVSSDWRSGEYRAGIRRKRYRSNVINWGMLPLQNEGNAKFYGGGLYLYSGRLAALETASPAITGYVIRDNVCWSVRCIYGKFDRRGGNHQRAGMPD